VLRKPDALGAVLLEDEPEAPLLLEPVDLRSQISPQSGVLDLVEQYVELVSDHLVGPAGMVIRAPPKRLCFENETGATRSSAGVTGYVDEG
jgi:hypothetical protein